MSISFFWVKKISRIEVEQPILLQFLQILKKKQILTISAILQPCESWKKLKINQGIEFMWCFYVHFLIRSYYGFANFTGKKLLSRGGLLNMPSWNFIGLIYSCDLDNPCDLLGNKKE